MKKSVENITELLRSGIGGLTLKSDDFRFSELSMFAQLAASSDIQLTIVVSDNLSIDEISQLAKDANGHLHVDFTTGRHPEKDYCKLFEELIFTYAHNPKESVCINAAHYAYSMFMAITGFDYDDFLFRQKQDRQQV